MTPREHHLLRAFQLFGFGLFVFASFGLAELRLAEMDNTTLEQNND